MIMAGISRRMGELNQRQGQRARIGISLMVGLVFFLCAKASVREEGMQTFVLKCGNLGDGKPTKDTDPRGIGGCTIYLAEASKISIPGEWRAVFKRLHGLEVTGEMFGNKEEDMQQAFLSDKEMQTLGKILVSVAEVSGLVWLSLQNIKIEGVLEFPKEFRMVKKMDTITLERIRCSRIAIPEGSQVKRVKRLMVEDLFCEKNNLLHVLSQMCNLEYLDIDNSNMENAMAFNRKSSLRELGELRYLGMAGINNKTVENVIKRVKMDKLEELEIENVDLSSLEIPETVKLPKLENLALVSAKIINLEGFKAKSFPRLESLSLQGNPGLRLGENMCTNNLLRKIRHLEMELETYKKGSMNLRRELLDLDTLILHKGGVEIVEIECIGKFAEMLEIMLNAEDMEGISEEDFGNLRIPHAFTCREMRVVISTGQTQLSEEWGERLTGMAGKCKHLKRFSLEFEKRQENLCALKLAESLKNRKKFEYLKVFEVRGVSADRTVGLEQLEMNWTEDFTGVEGIWNKEEEKWEVGYLPKTLKFHLMGSFEEWISSNEKGGKLITDGTFKGTRGPSEGEFTEKCAMCDKTFEEYAAAEWFIVLDCGDWICVDCTEHMYKAEHGEQPALSTKIGRVVRLKCSSCKEVVEHVVGELPGSPQENHQQASSEMLCFQRG
jgi:hypothetical protein